MAIIDVTPADPAGFLIARQLRTQPHAPPAVLTPAPAGCRFGSWLDRHRFAANVNLCARAARKRADYIL
jgi:hypothetical protein